MPVMMNFMVLIRCVEDDSCKSFLIPNHGRNIDDYGFVYSSPQPILDQQNWYSLYRKKLQWIVSGVPYADVGGLKFMISATVDDAGEASESSVVLTSVSSVGSYSDMASTSAESIQEARFIPGYFDDEPTRMSFYEYWVDPAGDTSNRPLLMPSRSPSPPVRKSSSSARKPASRTVRSGRARE